MIVGRSSSSATLAPPSAAGRASSGSAEHLEHDLARERVAVRVQARRRQPDHDVAGGEVARAAGSRALDDADAEPGEVVVAAVIEAGQLGGLAADERAAGLAAALGDAGDHGRARSSTSSAPVAK